MELVIKEGTKKEFQAIVRLLRDNQLPTADLEDKKIYVGTIHNNLIATIGIERYEQIALIRSMAVDETYKNKNIGKQMLMYLLELSQKEGISELYLITTTAKSYFKKHGFDSIDRSSVPLAIQSTQEFSSICPASADVMFLTLN